MFGSLFVCQAAACVLSFFGSFHSNMSFASVQAGSQAQLTISTKSADLNLGGPRATLAAVCVQFDAYRGEGVNGAFKCTS